MSYESIFVNSVISMHAKNKELRLGQALFNSLPREAATAVAGLLFDPFNKDLTVFMVNEWVQNHLIFDRGHIVAVFDGDRILVEIDPPDMAVAAVVKGG